MKRRKFGERSGYIIIVSVFLIMLNVVLGVFMINRSQKAIITQIEGRMLDITNTAADMLNGDKLKNLKKEDYYTKDYQDALKTLAVFQSNIELEYIYCVQRVSDKEFVFSVDPTEDDPGEFGSPIVYTDALYQASLGKASVDKQPYADEWGCFYSAYSPVFDSKGQVATIVAVDFSADWYNDQVFALVRTVLVICAVSLLAGGLIVFIITQQTRRRNRRLYAELNSLADNIEDLVKEVSNTAHTRYSHHANAESESGGNNINDLSNKIHAMQDDLRSEIATVHHMAYIDALTAVSNSTAYIDITKALNAQIFAGTARFSVIAFDLNGLKQINDTYGHDCGDKVLIDTARVICDVFGKENVYRVGGDEFIALLPTDNAEEIEGLFKTFDQKLDEDNKKIKSYSFPISVSKGYAVYQKGEDKEYKEVSHRADINMYHNKDVYYEQNSNIQRR
ncbi:MAG: diguanylate cyclase [Ruminococcus sp.]|nr:diguanylate cyclase [Ruminococcus sp.]